jgi:glyoxylase I family protein
MPAFPLRTTTMEISGIHHIAIIASDYARSKHFYVEVLGLQIVGEAYRSERDSWKLDLRVADGVQIELFSFPSPPPRVSRPEAAGLRHLAFRVADIDSALASLANHGVEAESIRIDEYTGRRFSFFADPDGLPLELYEG